MLDFADIVAINKFDRKGAKDAQRDVCKQVQRNREAFMQMPDTMPVFGTIAARFNDDGVTALYQQLKTDLIAKGWQVPSIGQLTVVTVRFEPATYHCPSPTRPLLGRDCRWCAWLSCMG